MTKADLLELLSDIPDDYTVWMKYHSKEGKSIPIQICSITQTPKEDKMLKRAIISFRDEFGK